MNFGNQISCGLSEEMPFELLPPYSPMLTKKKKMEKIQNFKFHKSLNNFQTLHVYEFLGVSHLYFQ